HIGHNCVVGEHCAMAGKSGLSGSVTLEDHVLIGGLAGVASGLRLRKGTRVGGMSMVIKDTEPGSYVVGAPARPQQQWGREGLGGRRPRDARPCRAGGAGGRRRRGGKAAEEP